ncbi:RloB family protein [Limnoraphis robusta]|uniref:RloB family protein n=1 Tax=Limnoraphis robusta CCNP1315 TaxID=3110306 RepID=A0ABU5TZL5_9CYAN|nr:RloB family protein [Limnoraphis robusta]MEA5520137.1 RloB family protein [Limnoraphis robusta CCNP1315]MEA5543893.1 RloB family protein [Limnoraphis robusta CCNP1324]
MSRRGKSTDKLKRTRGQRTPRKLILIVVEGQETEYNYFNDLKAELRLPTTEIKVYSGSGGDPCQVVEKANSYRNQMTSKPDEVFCIFDYDNKLEKYKQAIKKAQDYGFEESITSIPCFEIWLLLHFQYTSRSFQNCSEVETQLQRELVNASSVNTPANYDKSLRYYNLLKAKLNQAIENAERLEKEQQEIDQVHANPSTKVHLLVKKLREEKAKVP